MLIVQRRLRIPLALVIAADVCLVGCVQRPPAPPIDRTLRIAVALPTEGAAGSGVNGFTTLLTTDALISLGGDGREIPRLAERWEWNHSRTVLRVTLRERVLFHDGTPVTAEAMAQALRGSVAKVEMESLSSVSSVVAMDQRTLEIRLRQADAFVLPDLYVISIRKPGSDTVATGPFMVENRQGQTVLKAFESYYRGRPSINRIRISTYPTQRKAWAATLRGEADMLHEVSRDAVDFVEAETAVRTYSFPRPYYIPLVFNVRHPILSRPEVRRALNLAVDKTSAVREGLRSRGRPAESPVWPEHWANDRSHRSFGFEPEAARALLDGAGLVTSSVARAVMPTRFSFTCLVYADDARFERLALVIQKQLFDVGVDMKLEPVSIGQLGARARRGDFDAFLFELGSMRSLSYVYYFWHSAGPRSLFDSGYHAADVPLERLRRAASDEETRVATADLLDVLKRDPPAIFIAWQEQVRAVSARFAIPADAGRDIVGSVWQWQVKPAEQMQASR